MRIALMVGALAVSVSGSGFAQSSTAPRRSTEARIDGLFGRGSTVHGGASVTLPLGIYVRNALTVAGGSSWDGGTPRTTGRVDVVSRVTLDPFRERKWGIAAGGGMTLTDVPDGTWRPRLIGLLELEGPDRKGHAWALQIGLGSGARIGVLVRSANARWR